MTVILSFNLSSELEKAVMSPPTYRSLLIPTPPDTTREPVVLLLEFVVAFALNCPLDSSMSSTVVVPPAESIVKLPVEVSSSLAPVIPI